MTELFAARGDHAGYALLSLLGETGWSIAITVRDEPEPVRDELVRRQVEFVSVEHPVYGFVQREGTVAETACDLFEAAMLLRANEGPLL